MTFSNKQKLQLSSPPLTESPLRLLRYLGNFDIFLQHRGDLQEPSAVTVSPEEAQPFWGQQRDPHNVLVYIDCEHFAILLHLLVPLHQPSKQELPAELKVCSEIIVLRVRAPSNLCEQQTLICDIVCRDNMHIK